MPFALLNSLLHVAFYLGCFGLLCASIFSAMVAVAAFRFRLEKRSTSADFIPPVSILKPLHGDEPGLEENLRGFFEQDYPEFELLFCARAADDAGLQIARKLAAEYPLVPCRVLDCGPAPYVNAKVFSMETMARAAAHSILVVSDSDVHVTGRYLRRVVQPFAENATGLVTCLYRGVALQGGLWARLEAIGMSIEMTSGVIVSRMLGPIDFALGPTMAVRTEALEQIGGFGVLGQYCSDDYLLGNWVAEKGWQCRLSHHVIEHMVLNASFTESVRHQVRWMKSTRASLPKGHFGTGLTFAMPFGIVAAGAAFALGHWVSAGLALACSVAACAVRVWAVGAMVVREKNLFAKWIGFVVRDAMGFCFWMASYGNRRILWRGNKFELQRDGRMRKVTE
jgi:ceramide glucosyltransferase